MAREPRTDFTTDAGRRAMAQAIAGIAEHLGSAFPMLVGGERVTRAATFACHDPSRPGETVALFPLGDDADADAAVAAAQAALPDWREQPGAERRRRLALAADVFRPRRLEIAAWLCFETGRTWREADEEVAATIDTLEAAAAQFPSDAGPARGVTAILTPAHAPLALPARLAAAALARGDTVVLKPSSRAPLAAYKLAEAFRDAGLPDGAVNLLTGPGEIVGARVAAHPDTAHVEFTGARAHADRLAPLTAGKSFHADLAAKGYALVDRGVEPATTAAALVASAVRHAGQDRTAIAAAFVHRDLAESIATEISARLERLVVGPAIDWTTDVGPLRDAAAATAARTAMQEAATRGRELARADAPPEGLFVPPALVTDLPEESLAAVRAAPGPLLALIPVQDLAEGEQRSGRFRDPASTLLFQA